jgi:hypothetical protein
VAAAARAHPADGLLRPVQDSVEVDLQDPDDRRVVLALERTDGHDPRIVDEDLDGPEPLLDLVEERREAWAVGHVEPQAEGLAARLAGDGGRGGLVHVADRDSAALARQGQRQRSTDATTAAGDDGDPAVERAGLHGHETSYLLQRDVSRGTP